ncbi:hypothetical protein L2E82_38001 [Cichorium intybus]|uniref:Uncharacterized protein n=1 Tax=Cichorium intybus TaxID=13427 RepID=A0ACB9AGN2_CICIN|nr:hypothetical protein L2E82_38001 [Cichorium intybus]
MSVKFLCDDVIEENHHEPTISLNEVGSVVKSPVELVGDVKAEFEDDNKPTVQSVNPNVVEEDEIEVEDDDREKPDGDAVDPEDRDDEDDEQDGMNLKFQTSSMALAVTSSTSIVFSSSNRTEQHVVEKATEVIDTDKLPKDLENSSPLAIMDKVLEKYGDDIAIAFSKVRPLRRALKGLRAWITGQRKDQSPGTRSEVPVVQVDTVFKGMDGGSGSLVKFNPVANVAGNDIWSFLRTMDVPVNPLHAQRYVSIGCEPCTSLVLPGNLKEELVNGNGNGNGNGNSAADIFESQNVVNLNRTGIKNLVKMEDRKDAWMVVLYATWCPFCQQSGGYLDGIAPDGVLGLGLGEVSIPTLLAKSGITKNSLSLCFSEEDDIKLLLKRRNAGGRIRASGGSRNVRRGLQTTLFKVVQVEARRTSYLNVSTGSIDNLVTVTTTSQDVRSFEPIYEQDLSYMMQSYDLKEGKMKL